MGRRVFVLLLRRLCAWLVSRPFVGVLWWSSVASYGSLPDNFAFYMSYFHGWLCFPITLHISQWECFVDESAEIFKILRTILGSNYYVKNAMSGKMSFQLPDHYTGPCIWEMINLPKVGLVVIGLPYIYWLNFSMTKTFVFAFICQAFIFNLGVTSFSLLCEGATPICYRFAIMYQSSSQPSFTGITL